MDSKMKWAPQRYAPSVVMTRVPTLPHLQLPPPGPILAADDSFDGPTLVLTKFIGGGQFDYHAASLRQDGHDDARLVLLMLDLSHFPESKHRRVKESIVQQVFFYTRLEPAQGRFVPRFAGLFNHGTLYALVFDDAGRRLSYAKDFEVKGIKYVATDCQSLTGREELLETVKGINEAGVIVGPRWWYLFNRGADGVVRMSNFDPTEVETIENFSPEFYARVAAEGIVVAANESPQETFERWAEDSRKFMLEEMFNEYDD